MKKLLAVLLVLCLFVGMMPMAFAEETDDYVELIGPAEPAEPTEPVENDEAPLPTSSDNAINTTTNIVYNFIQDALADANSGDTIVLRSTAVITNEESGGLTIEVEEGVTLVIPEGVTLTIENQVRFVNNGTINGRDKINGNVEDGEETTPPEEGGGEEPEKPPVIALYSVTFDFPSWVDIVVRDSNGAECSEFKHHVWSLPNGEYTYTLSYDGVEFGKGSFEVNGSPLYINEGWAGPAWRVIVKPSSHGDVWVSERYADYGEYVKIYVEPDSGYYLEDLTVTTESGRDVEVWHVRDGVFAFRMTYSPVTVDADFAALPDEHRVYVEPTVNGDLSVDEVWAEEGEWVYITVKPDAGYRLDELTVTRPSGNEVKVYHVRDNVFRFKMPGVRVTVDAEFVRSSLPFSDVSRGQWFYDYVAWAYNTGLMEGVSAGRFAPNSTTTRAMVVTIIYRLAGSPGVSGTSDFTDVPAGAWYADAVTWAAKRGIVEGMTATTFDPNDAVTREELAAMLYRYAKHKGYDTSAAENTNILSYNDAGSISEYAFEALQWACGEGIINGTGGGSLEPGGSATRAQLAAMLYRFCAEYVY